MTEPNVPFLWIVSYPKSGNTWMRAMLRSYIQEVLGEKPFECNDVSQYWYQTVSPIPLDTMKPMQVIQLRPAAMMHMTLFQELRKKPKPAAVIKSHMASVEYCGIPAFSTLWVDRAVYIYRDPRDVLPSLADHMGKTLAEAATMMSDDTATLGDNEKGKLAQPMSTWSAHVMSWLNQKRVDCITTSYEKMHEDTARELRKVIEFFELPLDEEAVQKAVEDARFNRLQKLEEEHGFMEKSEKQERFFRRGIVGSHKDEVPRALVRRIKKDHGRLMGILGYK